MGVYPIGDHVGELVDGQPQLVAAYVVVVAALPAAGVAHSRPLLLVDVAPPAFNGYNLIMGKPIKPADPEAERAELRQLTRELNEATRDARTAARELREARQTIQKTVDKTVEEMMLKLSQDIAGAIKSFTEAGDARVDFQVNHVEECAKICIDKVDELVKDTEARLIGYKNADEIGEKVANGIHGAIHELAADRQFIDEVAAALSEHVTVFVPNPGGVNHVAMRSRLLAALTIRQSRGRPSI